MIQRFDVIPLSPAGFFNADEGKFVLYADHLELVEKFQQEILRLDQKIITLITTNTKQAEEIRRLRTASEIRIVFDGPPGPEAGRFIEVENEQGESICFGEWSHKGDYWYLSFPYPIAALADKEQEYQSLAECFSAFKKDHYEQIAVLEDNKDLSDFLDKKVSDRIAALTLSIETTKQENEIIFDEYCQSLNMAYERIEEQDGNLATLTTSSATQAEEIERLRKALGKIEQEPSNIVTANRIAQTALTVGGNFADYKEADP